MCGRYATYGPVSLSREAKQALESMGLDLASEINQRDDQFNIAPTQRALVITLSDRSYQVGMFRWGLIPSWAKDLKVASRLFNARAETVNESKVFRSAFRRHRCLIPASGFFEWKGEPRHKQPYFIHEPAGHLMMFAGLHATWQPANDGEWIRSFTILTGKPARVSHDIHDRSPVILPPDLWQVWVEGSVDDAEGVLAAAPEPDLAVYPVTKALASPKNNGPELIEPVSL
ncbi:putative SOS response-associated peptidase YedK [Luteibacter sp. Sphag1AF]|uniref:SOS response-associated peptidase n=1 Tax=Luteibacter sp. Sphag1AF TaxID=2587031 RepID=UPI00161E7369|nr:SOS response-associated peptidase [Luteibacter sp. Sphag1AF]MBB3228119.1 putative SOS response-associated peptidase YedK [Luteibacter sp. Sphag1AF]